MISVTGYSQGTFIFNNRDPGNGINAIVTHLCTGVGVSVGFTAQIYVVHGTSLSPLLPTATFGTGAAAGYVNAPADPISVPGVPSGVKVTLRMLAFNGSDYLSASERGQSADFTITLGGGGSPPPSPLTGLAPFTVQFLDCPEPTTIALGILGLGAFLIRRKK